MELHVFIEVTGPIPDAYLRMAHAMEEVKKFLIPVSVLNNIPSFIQTQKIISVVTIKISHCLCCLR